MAKVAIIYHSGYGHTKIQAEYVLEGAKSVENIEAQMFSVDQVKENWEFINASDAIIFGSPTYMGTISAPFKAFMDVTSKIWFKQGWKDKLAAGFTNSGWPSGDKFNTLLQIMTFAAQHSMIWVSLGFIPGNLSKKPGMEKINRLGSFVGAMAQSEFNTPRPDEGDLETAKLLGERVAELAKKHSCQ